MGGEANLDVLIQSMSAELQDGIFVFCTFPDMVIPKTLSPIMTFRETEGLTAILHQHEAAALDLAGEFPCRMITLNIHSALDAVGFLARITTALAHHNMGVNPVSAFFHDHLFVPEDRAEDALRILQDMSRRST